jgi:predicted metal-dependent hydrolase
MNRAIRDSVVELLLRAFRDATAGDAILCLAVFWDLLADARQDGVTLFDLEAAWARHYPDRAAHARARTATEALNGIVTLRRGPAETSIHGSEAQEAVELLVEPHAAALAFLQPLREYTHICAQVVRDAATQMDALERMAPLNRTVAEAAMCFNAGLFFEAHEHLEHHWVRLSRGPSKRFMQGLIQISVGCHHAMRGSYDGAVNQLGKGLAKLAEAPSDTLGLDAHRLRRETEEVRQRITARGRGGMRRATLDELPRMHLTGC